MFIKKIIKKVYNEYDHRPLCLRYISPITHLFVGKPLGKGTFGHVKLGSHILTGEKVIIHRIEHCIIGCCEDFRERQNKR